MSRNKKIALIAVIVILIAAMALYPVIKRNLFPADDSRPVRAENTQPGRARALNVNAQVMRYETLDQTFQSVGILYPDEEVELVFESSGVITQILFQEGRSVEKGQLLAKINDRPLQAELSKLEAQIPLAEARVYRQQQLLEKEAVSQESYESVLTDLEKLKADIELVRSRIAQTELRAPFDGEIGLRQVSEGTYASPTVVIASLTKIRPLKIEFSVNEKDIDILEPGKALFFKVGNDPEIYQAKVYARESIIDRSTFALRVRALYPNSDGKLKPGKSATVSMGANEDEMTLLVPSIALTADLGRDYVYVYRRGFAEQVNVRKGDRTASSIRILDGLVPGDTLITSGVMQLRDGMPVELDRLDHAQE